MGFMSPGSREFQAEVARVALAAARDHGFALAGGNALAVHGIISRPTEDVDLFAPGDGAVQAAAGLVAAALAEAGFTAADVTSGSDLAERSRPWRPGPSRGITWMWRPRCAPMTVGTS